MSDQNQKKTQERKTFRDRKTNLGATSPVPNRPREDHSATIITNICKKNEGVTKPRSNSPSIKVSNSKGRTASLVFKRQKAPSKPDDKNNDKRNSN